jgi:hypothetical protein
VLRLPRFPYFLASAFRGLLLLVTRSQGRGFWSVDILQFQQLTFHWFLNRGRTQWSEIHMRTAWDVQKGRRWLKTASLWAGQWPPLWAGHPCGLATPETALRPFQGVALPQDIDGSGMAGPGETLGSPWPPLGIRLRL